MVQRKKIVDKRDDDHKDKYPWWWRNMDSALGTNKLYSTKENKIAAYRYESGRRWLQRSDEVKWGQLPPYPELLNPKINPESDFAYKMLHKIIMSFCIFGVYSDPEKKQLTKKKVMTYMNQVDYQDGEWVILKNLAWNLNSSWSHVSRMLHMEFERQQSEAKLRSRSPRSEVQIPSWESLEVWDCWNAKVDLLDRYKTGGLGHEKKADHIKNKSKKYGLWLAQLFED
jgi:hypothetical protein